MAKLYDFSIVLRHAEFYEGVVTIPYGNSRSVYLELCVQATLKEAIQLRQALSDALDKPHVAIISMKYREDRKPPGFSKIPMLHAAR